MPSKTGQLDSEQATINLPSIRRRSISKAFERTSLRTTQADSNCRARATFEAAVHDKA